MSAECAICAIYNEVANALNNESEEIAEILEGSIISAAVMGTTIARNPLVAMCQAICPRHKHALVYGNNVAAETIRSEMVRKTGN